MDPPRSVLAQSHGSARRYKRRRPWPSEPAVALTFPAIARGLTPSRGLSGRRLGHGSRTDRTQQSRSDRDGHVSGSGPRTRPAPSRSHDRRARSGRGRGPALGAHRDPFTSTKTLIASLSSVSALIIWS